MVDLPPTGNEELEHRVRDIVAMSPHGLTAQEIMDRLTRRFARKGIRRENAIALTVYEYENNRGRCGL